MKDKRRLRLGRLASLGLVGLGLGCAAIPDGLDPAKPHHTPTGFTNPGPYDPPGGLDFLRWQWRRLGKDIPGPEAYDFPLAGGDPARLLDPPGRAALTWIGHSTLLLQLQGVNILTDPHFSRRASPVQWAGPQRVVPPGVALAKLPAIQLVLISHNHYDHLDTPTIRKLLERPGGRQTLFLVPLGLKAWFTALGASRVVELDWWQSLEVMGLELTAVPVKHWSKRSLFGKNRTLWAGWAIRDDRLNVLYAGDSGYTLQFKEIGRRLGPFDLAALPIGAYAPRWFMQEHHMTPEEAVQAHRDVDSKLSVAIHWGTFILSDEPLDEPPRRLRAARARGGEDFRLLRHGEILVVK